MTECVERLEKSVRVMADEQRPLRLDSFTGLDVGQSHDPTALAVVEWAEEAGEWDAATS